MDMSAKQEIRPRILYCFPRISTFIQRDITELSKRFDVHVHNLDATPSWKLPFRLVHQFVWLVRNKAWKRDCICHFSGYHALLPAWLCRRTFIILAGSDCASIPAIRYGNHARLLMGRATCWAAAHATRLLPVHGSLMYRVQHFSNTVPAEQGLLAFGPRIATPWTVVPYGFDAGFWIPGAAAKRNPELFICVPGPATPNNKLHRLKGVDVVLAIAERLPQAHFLVVGVAEPVTYAQVSANVSFRPHLDRESLRDLYRAASFHLQLSRSEGMPNALCEAMLCGCIPVVSAISSMPEIVRGIGFIQEHDDPDQGAALCNIALNLSAAERTERSNAARERIVRKYPLERRSDQVNQLLLSPDDV